MAHRVMACIVMAYMVMALAVQPVALVRSRGGVRRRLAAAALERAAVARVQIARRAREPRRGGDAGDGAAGEDLRDGNILVMATY